MADKDTKALLNTIVSSVTKNTDVSTDVQSDIKMILELVNTIYQRVEDMSKKYDGILNVGLKKPKITPPKKPTPSTDIPKKKKVVDKKEETKSEPKLIKNIMTYFKFKYFEDQTIFDSILEESQAAALFEEHANALADKKGAAKLKAQASLLYKILTKDQKKKIKEKMLDENDAASINNDDDIECDDSD
jgi:hypothetical protein